MGLVGSLDGEVTWMEKLFIGKTNHGTWESKDFGISSRFWWRRQWQPTPVPLPGKIPWMEETGRLQSMGSHRVRHD